MLGVTRLILDREDGSASGEDDFFSVARTMPFVAVRVPRSISMLRYGGYHGKVWAAGQEMVRGAGMDEPLMPRAVTPWLTALRAYSVEC